MGCKWKVTWEVLPAYAGLKESGGWRGRNLNTGCCDSYLEQDTPRALFPSCSNHHAHSHVHSREPACLALLENCFHLSHSSPAVALHPGADQTFTKRGVSLPSTCKCHLTSHREIESRSARVWITCLLISFEVATKWALRCFIATVVSPETLPSPLQKRPL